jgi:hypothetical protein
MFQSRKFIQKNVSKIAITLLIKKAATSSGKVVVKNNLLGKVQSPRQSIGSSGSTDHLMLKGANNRDFVGQSGRNHSVGCDSSSILF